jgi:hypothetical protein
MEHPSKEQAKVLDAFINEIVSIRYRFVNYVLAHELLPTLTKAEVEFMNEIALACEKLKDSNTVRKAQ